MALALRKRFIDQVEEESREIVIDGLLLSCLEKQRVVATAQNGAQIREGMSLLELELALMKHGYNPAPGVLLGRLTKLHERGKVTYAGRHNGEVRFALHGFALHQTLAKSRS